MEYRCKLGEVRTSGWGRKQWPDHYRPHSRFKEVSPHLGATSSLWVEWQNQICICKLWVDLLQPAKEESKLWRIFRLLWDHPIWFYHTFCYVFLIEKYLKATFVTPLVQGHSKNSHHFVLLARHASPPAPSMPHHWLRGHATHRQACLQHPHSQNTKSGLWPSFKKGITFLSPLAGLLPAWSTVLYLLYCTYWKGNSSQVRTTRVYAHMCARARVKVGVRRGGYSGLSVLCTCAFPAAAALNAVYGKS